MLPRGWAEASLGDVADTIRGVTYEKANARTVPGEGLIPILRATNIHRFRLDRDELVYVPERCVEKQQMLQPGDVLIATSSGSRSVVGKAAMASGSLADTSFGAFCGVVRPLVEETRDWLARVFETAEYRTFVESVAIGTNINNLRTRDLQAYTFSLPPAAEQRRIVTKLNGLTVRLARARAELDRVPVLAANLRSTALAKTYRAIVEQGGTLPIEHFVATLDQGWSPKCESFPAPDDSWGVLKTTAIQPLDFWPRENKALPAGLTPRPRIEVKQGDILVTRAGPRVRCGITCLVRETPRKLLLADKMYRLRCKPNLALPAYLALMLNAPESLALIESMKTGISDSGLNLTQEKFLSIPIPNLSVEGQETVVSQLEVAFARAGRLEAEATRARALIDRLESAILAKAFRGELVPQDPDEEPASVLIERIRAQRSAAPKSKRRRRASAEA